MRGSRSRSPRSALPGARVQAIILPEGSANRRSYGNGSLEPVKVPTTLPVLNADHPAKPKLKKEYDYAFVMSSEPVRGSRISCIHANIAGFEQLK
jgi:hypothetical protein